MNKKIIAAILVTGLIFSSTFGVYADDAVQEEVITEAAEQIPVEEPSPGEPSLEESASEKLTGENSSLEEPVIEETIPEEVTEIPKPEETEVVQEEQVLVEEQSIVASGECGENVAWTLDDAGLLTISGTGDMYDYKSSKSPWYSQRAKIKTVKVEDGVTSIGGYAFDTCYNLTKADIGKDIKKLKNYAFYSCNRLASVNIPDSVTSIGWDAFRGCSSLKSVTIPDSVTSIGYYAFEGCSSLTSINIPDSVTSIGYYAFEGCSSLTSINIPDSVTSIGDSTFEGCSSLKSVTIPDSVTSIGDRAFSGCSSLTSINIPDSVTSIGYRAFYGCSSLTSVTIPDSVTTIEAWAFSGCSSLTSITIPDSVTTIGDYAFDGCSSLTNVTIPDSVTVIEAFAFGACESLTSVVIPDSMTSIGDNAFAYCKNLTKVSLPEGVGINFTKAVVSGVKNTGYYNGHQYDLSVKLNNKVQSEYQDYNVYYDNNDGPGKATVTVVGRGQNIGAVKKTYYMTFYDVPATHAYKDAVYWATDKGIAAGYSGSKEGYFGVNDNITRGQVVMFLWRAAGKPAPKKNKQTFKDVPTKHAFYKAIQWASEKGIVAGYSNGNFGVNDNCTRGQIAMFLWRYSGKPAPKKHSQTFKDVLTKHAFYNAVQWASEQKITAGYKDGRFGVGDTCTRGQCVTFLYRMLK